MGNNRPVKYRKSLNILMVGLAISALGFLSACRGPEGPMGPTGAAGAGTQTTYVYAISPAGSSGTYDAVCPAVVVDNVHGDYSTVSCYLHFTGYDDAPLVPYTETETDDSTTNYFYSVEHGKVILGWINSATTTPGDFELVVTVVN
ncbi:hypothetical protein K8S19_09080 [bacterium]|nr:hypothetical protein [bacterium]